MANRSDDNSVLPRRYKRMIALGVANGTIGAGQHEREVRKIFINAHAHARKVRNSRNTLVIGKDVDLSEEAAA
jgi:hypothetical protein